MPLDLRLGLWLLGPTVFLLRLCENKPFTTLPAWTYAKYMSPLCTRYICVKAFVKVLRCLTSVFEKWTSACACWQLSAWTQGCQTAQHTLWASSLMGMRLRTQDLSKNLVSFVPFIWKSWESNKRFKRTMPTMVSLLPQLTEAPFKWYPAA